jgi:methylphosphotriester-DNA--protein-cysteine methyltransferase
MPVLRADNRLRYLHWGLCRALDTNTALLAETCASELFREIPEARTAPPARYRPHTFDRNASRVHAARKRMDRSYGEPLRLDDIARSVGMSTFHFARRFAELIGMPPHRYLLDRRHWVPAFAGVTSKRRHSAKSIELPDFPQDKVGRP